MLIIPGALAVHDLARNQPTYETRYFLKVKTEKRTKSLGDTLIYFWYTSEWDWNLDNSCCSIGKDRKGKSGRLLSFQGVFATLTTTGLPLCFAWEQPSSHGNVDTSIFHFLLRTWAPCCFSLSRGWASLSPKEPWNEHRRPVGLLGYDCHLLKLEEKCLGGASRAGSEPLLIRALRNKTTDFKL